MPPRASRPRPTGGWPSSPGSARRRPTASARPGSRCASPATTTPSPRSASRRWPTCTTSSSTSGWACSAPSASCRSCSRRGRCGSARPGRARPLPVRPPRGPAAHAQRPGGGLPARVRARARGQAATTARPNVEFQQLLVHFMNQVALYWRDKRVSDVIRERAFDPSFGSIAVVRRAGAGPAQQPQVRELRARQRPARRADAGARGGASRSSAPTTSCACSAATTRGTRSRKSCCAISTSAHRPPPASGWRSRDARSCAG